MIRDAGDSDDTNDCEESKFTDCGTYNANDCSDKIDMCHDGASIYLIM